MDASNLLKLVKKQGSLDAIKSIEIEDINDIELKIICRTIEHSNYQLLELLKQKTLVEKKSA